MNRLLILSCSQSKRPEAQLLPAYERYDGPSFRLLRRFLSQNLNRPSVYILSAEYGLIHSNQCIPFYDRQMTRQRALELRSVVTAKLKRIFKNKLHEGTGDVLICVGKDYFQVVDGTGALFSSTPLIKVAEGSPGRKLSYLHDWLYGHPPKLPSSTRRTKGKAILRGVEVALLPSQVFEIARAAIAERRGDPTGFKSWYVTLDKVRLSPKWLVSQLTGVPVSGFSTIEALRFLSQLGIKAERV
jgi:hypothetical protein